MLAEKFKQIQLEIGFGRNLFKTKEGKYSYKQQILKRKKLVRLSVTEISDSQTEIKFINHETDTICSILLTERNGFIYVDLSGSLPEEINRYWLTFPKVSPEEHFYGCGKTHSKFDLADAKVRIWVANQPSFAQPTFVSSEKYFIHSFANSYSEFDFRKKNKIVLYFQETPHFVAAEESDFPSLSKKMTEILGNQNHLPDWVYDGVILAVQQGNSVIDRKIESAQKAGIKISGIFAKDWSGFRKVKSEYHNLWNWKSDHEGQYPDLKEKIAEWKTKGIHFLGYINPFISTEKEIYREASEKGFCIRNRLGNDYLVRINHHSAAMLDFTNPLAYNWYKELIKTNLIGIGMSGWMADFGECLPMDCILHDNSSPATIHNQWPAIWAKLNREAIEESGKQNEVFFFTKSGYTGTVSASAMMWTGEHHVNWSLGHGIGSVIPATLSLAMSGFGLTHSDVGGHTSKIHIRRSKELLMRWAEMNVFSPLWRSHEGNKPAHNIQFDSDDEILNHIAKCSKMHAALKDYLKSLVNEHKLHGIPVMRPLFYHYSDEKKAFSERAEYLLGRDVLVCPILKKGTTTKKCYLPNDSWINIFSRKEYSGGIFDVFAKIGEPAVFVRKSSEWKNLLLALAEV